MDVTTLWETRKEMVDEFMRVLAENRYPITSPDRALLECFWTYILVKQLGVKYGQE